MLGVSSNGKWSHNIASQSTGGLGRERGASRRKCEAGVISLVSIQRASQAFSKSLTFIRKSISVFFSRLFSMYFIKMSSIGISVLNYAVIPYQASPTGPVCKGIPIINITVNQETGGETHKLIVRIPFHSWHCKCQTPFSNSEDFTDSSLSFPPKGREFVPQNTYTDTKTYPGLHSRQTGPNGS